MIVYFFTDTGSAEQHANWYCGKFLGLYDAYSFWDGAPHLNEIYQVHTGFGVFKNYQCVAVDESCALLQHVI